MVPPPPILGTPYLKKLGNTITSKLKQFASPLFKDGIGDGMDKVNLWIVPGFTLFAFAVLWTTKLSKIALEEPTCLGGTSKYDFTGTELDNDAKRHCQTADRYYVDTNEEAFLLDQAWRTQRQVKNPDWILWFWAPIVLVMYVLMRLIWSLLLDNQGIDFTNVVNASQNIRQKNDGVSEVNKEVLRSRLSVIAANFGCASSSHALCAFLTFEVSLVMAPLLLLLLILPLMIGSSYRSWGLDVFRTWWERKEWQGSKLTPFLGSSHKASVPLFPRVTYCDYKFDSLYDDNGILTYHCEIDANWHERTALFTWFLLAFLTIINFANLCFWVIWAIRMLSRKQRANWVLKKWLNDEDPERRPYMKEFASEFKSGNLLLFYFIEAHTDRVVASAFCTELFLSWLNFKKKKETLVASNPSTAIDSASAQFNASAPADIVSYHQQHSATQQLQLRPQQQQGPALAYTQTASVNYPSNEVSLTATTIDSTSTASNGPSTTSTMSNNGQQKYETNGGAQSQMATMQQQSQPPNKSIQQQQAQQQLYHQQTVPQDQFFPAATYNIPSVYHQAAMNMCNYVATAAGLPCAEVDRFLMQQYPYATLLDMQFSALSMANAAQQQQQTMPPPPQQQHREQQHSGAGYTDLAKCQQQLTMGQQQVNAQSQGMPTGESLSYQQQQSLSSAQSGQQQRNDAATNQQGMDGNIATPPGFGVPTQQYHPQQAANLQKLFFQMPEHMSSVYPHAFMMQGRGQQQHGGRSTMQNSPPENVPQGRGEQQHYGSSNINNNKYRPYM